MLSPSKFWINDESSFFDISEPDKTIDIKWNKKVEADYIYMAEAYYHSAEIITIDIISEKHDNSKYDQWFFSAMYLYRQAIELLCKGIVATYFDSKTTKSLFLEYRHNVFDLFKQFISQYEIIIPEAEKDWLVEYLSKLEQIDKNSNLFRYPIKDGILKDYNDNFLDIVDMANGFNQSYAILYKYLDEKYMPLKYSNDIDTSMSTDVLHFASHGIGNCMLYQSIWDDGYYTHIKGFSEVVIILMEKQTIDLWKLFPLLFLLRHAIELSLKQMLHSRTDYCVNKKVQNSIKSTHNLYKKLWKNVKPIVTHYAQGNNYDLEQIDIADKCLLELHTIDTSGFVFRYPTTFDLQHQLNTEQIDYLHSIHWMIGLFNFLEGCSAMLDAAYEYECEMRSNYFEF